MYRWCDVMTMLPAVQVMWCDDNVACCTGDVMWWRCCLLYRWCDVMTMLPAVQMMWCDDDVACCAGNVMMTMLPAVQVMWCDDDVACCTGDWHWCRTTVAYTLHTSCWWQGWQLVCLCFTVDCWVTAIVRLLTDFAPVSWGFCGTVKLVVRPAAPRMFCICISGVRTCPISVFALLDAVRREPLPRYCCWCCCKYYTDYSLLFIPSLTNTHRLIHASSTRWTGILFSRQSILVLPLWFVTGFLC